MRVRSIEIGGDVADVLSRSTWQGTTLILPVGQLDRKLYEAVNKVLTTLGGKWNRHEKGHVFRLDARDDLVAALDTGSAVDVKKTFEQFFTPPHIADRMAGLLEIEEGMKVLEPSAGNGALVHVANRAGAHVTAYEIDPLLRQVLLDRFFNQFGSGGIGVDFMEAPPNHVFDRVIMNPPFSNGQDVAHVLRAYECLRPGGRLAAIMSPHWTFAEDRASANFRVWCAHVAGKISTEALPDGTFKSAGTAVSSVLIVINKPQEGPR